MTAAVPLEPPARRRPGHGRPGGVERPPHAEERAGSVVLRVESGLFLVIADHVLTAVRDLLCADTRLAVSDGRTMPWLDVTGPPTSAVSAGLMHRG